MSAKRIDRSTESTGICFDCGVYGFYRSTSEGDSYDAVRMASRRHAEDTGHKVRFVTEITTVYATQPVNGGGEGA